MEHTKIEADLIQLAAAKANEAQIFELHELELALVGGGIGETVAQ